MKTLTIIVITAFVTFYILPRVEITPTQTEQLNSNHIDDSDREELEKLLEQI